MAPPQPHSAFVVVCPPPFRTFHALTRPCVFAFAYQKVEGLDRSRGNHPGRACVRLFQAAVRHGEDGHGDTRAQGTVDRASAAAGELEGNACTPCPAWFPRVLLTVFIDSRTSTCFTRWTLWPANYVVSSLNACLFSHPTPQGFCGCLLIEWSKCNYVRLGLLSAVPPHVHPWGRKPPTLDPGGMKPPPLVPDAEKMRQDEVDILTESIR